jgi:hypothetical protein
MVCGACEWIIGLGKAILNYGQVFSFGVPDSGMEKPGCVFWGWGCIFAEPDIKAYMVMIPPGGNKGGFLPISCGYLKSKKATIKTEGPFQVGYF